MDLTLGTDTNSSSDDGRCLLGGFFFPHSLRVKKPPTPTRIEPVVADSKASTLSTVPPKSASWMMYCWLVKTVE